VLHVGAAAKPAPHRLPDFARIVDGRIVYDVGVTAPLALPSRDE